MLRACVLLAVSVLSLAAADVSPHIRTEIERIRDLVSKASPDARFKDLKSHIDDTLKTAAEDLAAGNVCASLEKLAQASDMSGGMRAAANDAEVTKGGLPAFEIKRQKSSQRVSEIGPVPPGAPAAIRALIDTARVKATALVDGGRGFATSMHPQDGLFYLGEAEALADFARLSARLGIERKGAPLAVHSIAPQLQALQDKTNAAFVPPASIEKHSIFISLNASIKLARELDEANLHAGALYQYLDAVRQYGILNASRVEPSTKDALRNAISAERRKTAASERDDSIAQAWLERAESAIAHAPSDDVWRGVALVPGEVLAAYYAALGTGPSVEAPAGKAVEVTLVRWPYT